jgi:transcriptional regulator with XRE-family HTH domain
MGKSIFTLEQEKLQELLRQIRQEAGLRQSELAKRLKVSQSYVSKYEAGEKRLDLIELRRICQAMGISLEEFVRRFEGLLERESR